MAEDLKINVYSMNADEAKILDNVTGTYQSVSQSFALRQEYYVGDVIEISVEFSKEGGTFCELSKYRKNFN